MNALSTIEKLFLLAVLVIVGIVVVTTVLDAAGSASDAAKSVGDGVGAGAEMFGILSGMGVLALLI